MVPHVLVDATSCCIACRHCGVIEQFQQPIPPHALIAWINSFESNHGDCLFSGSFPELHFPRAMPVGFDPRTATPGFETWLKTGSRGLSSETLASYLSGLPVLARAEWTHPREPDDLMRCEGLLNAVPMFRPRLQSMSEVSAQWARLVAVWYDLVDAMRMSIAEPANRERVAAMMQEISEEHAH